MYAHILYELFVMLLVITYALLIFADPANHPELTEELLRRVDLFLILFLFVEFIVRLWMAKEKRRFLKENWFDIVAMIPFDQFFYLARFMRVVRLVRILRASPFMWSLLHSPSIRWIFTIAGMIMLWSSMGIYFLEKGINENVQTFSDALWWSIVTTTTVGYGDISPVTGSGRTIAAFLMLTGIGLLGALTANFANHWSDYFMGKQGTGTNRVHHELKNHALKQVQQIETLSEEEFATLVSTLELLHKPQKHEDHHILKS
ncbi:MAG TPA: ion transporter [Candidatus Bathyarchaeia archaeon]|nr:ion transporter [Candidatus Bathyarchaeia archaeon]